MTSEASANPLLSWSVARPSSQDTISMHSVSRRSLRENNSSNIANGDPDAFFPSFEGYLTLQISLFLSEYATDAIALTQHNDDVVEDRLDSLMLFFLCSRDIDLVVSPSPDELTSVCPFQDNVFDVEENSGNRMRRQLASLLQGMADQWRRMLEMEAGSRKAVSFNVDDPTSMLLWNVPKVEQDVIMLGGRTTDEDEHVSEDSEEYFTKWTFTYPVYNWGPSGEGGDDLSDQERVQLLLDDSIESGTFGTVLPWEDAEVSTVGNELRTFTDAEFLDDDALFVSSYDNGIPQSKTKLLQGIGSAMVIFNTIFVVIMTILAKRHRLQKQHKAEQARSAGGEEHTGGGLTTEEGVSEMLLESKMFAMEKSQEFRKSMVQRSHSGGGKRRGVDPPAPLLLASTSSSSNKEVKLVNEAAGHKKAFSGRLLANVSMEEDDQDDHVDFRPPSPFGQKKSPGRRKSRRREAEEC
jgi:hypothetical protein